MSSKWTVLFLVHASDRNTGKYAHELFTILESTNCSKEIKVLVLYGSLQSSDSKGYKIQVTLKEMSKNDSSNTQSLKEIKNWGVIDMGDDKKLGPIFFEIRNKYPSERLLLFTWDHGSGFGIFKTNPIEPVAHTKKSSDVHKRGLDPDDSLKPVDICNPNSVNSYTKRSFINEEDDYRSEGGDQLIVITNERVQEIHTREFGELKRDYKEKVKTSMLTNDELRNTIKYDDVRKKPCSDTKKVDLLIMMNCLMQMIETGYALHDAVEYLVAPETCIFWAGYDYKKIINKLCSDPDIGTEAVARYSIDTIKSYYQTTTYKKSFDDLVISLVKPENSKEVKNKIDRIAGELCNDLHVLKSDVKNTRNNCMDLSRKYVQGVPYHYIDFVHFLFCLSKKVSRLKKSMDELKKIIAGYVIHIFKGGNYDALSKEEIGLVNGFTIYFPPTSRDAHNDYYYEWFYLENPHQTLFAKECRWQWFLMDYFDGDAKEDKLVRMR